MGQGVEIALWVIFLLPGRLTVGREPLKFAVLVRSQPGQPFRGINRWEHNPIEIMSLVTTPLASEASLTTANAFAGASYVRIYNNTAGDIVITVANTTNSTSYTMTVQSKTIEYIRKLPTSTIAAASAVLATPISTGTQ